MADKITERREREREKKKARERVCDWMKWLATLTIRSVHQYIYIQDQE